MNFFIYLLIFAQIRYIIIRRQKIRYGEMSELAEGASLEMMYTATAVPGVRIPISPPEEMSRNFFIFAESCKKRVFGCVIRRAVKQLC